MRRMRRGGGAMRMGGVKFSSRVADKREKGFRQDRSQGFGGLDDGEGAKWRLPRGEDLGAVRLRGGVRERLR